MAETTFDFYVANGGSDIGPGTFSNPFATISKGLQAATAALTGSGKSVGVRGGTYTTAVNNPSAVGGTSWTNKVRVANYGSEVVWIRPNSGFNCITFSTGNQRYVEFDGINLDGTNITGDLVKLEAGNLAGQGYPHHIRIKNAELKNALTNSMGVLCTATDATAASQGGNEFINLIVRNVGIWDSNHAFYIQSSNNLIDGCNIYDIAGAGIQNYNGYSQNANSNTYRNNYIHDLKTGILNIGPPTSPGRHQGIIVYATITGVRIYNNIIDTIPNNGGGSSGIEVSGSNVLLDFNTVYGVSGTGVHIVSGSANRVRNCIIYNNTTNYTDTGTATVEDHNSRTGTNPQFVDPAGGNFRLSVNTPASIVKAGEAIAGLTTDKDVITRATPPSLGAYEVSPMLSSWAGRERIHRKRTHPAHIFSTRTIQPPVFSQVGMVTFSYPDEIYTKKRRHASRQPAVAYNRFEPQPTANDSFLTWMGQFPTHVNRRQMRTATRQTFAQGRDGSSGIPSPALAWQPEYPDRIVRRRLLAAWQLPFTTDPKPFFVNEDVRWLAEYPDLICRDRLPTAAQIAYIAAQPTTSGPIVGKIWDVQYPDWIAPRKGLKPYLPQTFHLDTEPTPNPALIENSWAAFHPDFATKSRMIVAARPTTFWSNFTPERVPYEWYLQRPDKVWSPRRNPIGGYLKPDSEAPAALPTDWTSTFPDLIDSIFMRERPAVFEPSASVFPAIGILHAWGAEYPDHIWQKHQTPAGAIVWVIPQNTSGDGVDCIEIVSQDVVYSTLTAETLMSSRLTDESLTTPSGIREVIC